MQSFGFKVVEKDLAEIRPVVHKALETQRPLEVGLYFGNEQALAFLDGILPSATIPLNSHINHNKFNVFQIQKDLDGFKAQVEQSVKWGAKYGITHISRYPTSPRAAHKDRLFDYLLENTRIMNDICAEYDFELNIENTFHQLDFYREYFSGVKDAGLKRIHHCFDIGHAKIWSKQPLAEWLDFIQELNQDGVRLHFHLHANSGLWDDHWSFVRADEMGITAADTYTESRDYFQRLSDIAQRFPESTKVFEVPPGEAIANMDLVMERIAAV